ncbi:MAG TPA: 7-cyano-7-deazaguanine synthase [Nitrososphaerales archaeon]
MTRAKYDVRALTFEYHGMSKLEVESAKAIAARAGVKEHRLFRLPDLREAGDIPGGRFGGLPPTYIPLRNSIFYTIAGSFAEEKRVSLIVGGHNRDDAKVFRDVKGDFFEALERTLWSGSTLLDRQRTRIRRPLRSKTKVQVLKLAASLEVPFELTWSCHRDGTEHCWECAGCLSRVESFKVAGLNDPLNPISQTKVT